MKFNKSLYRFGLVSCLIMSLTSQSALAGKLPRSPYGPQNMETIVLNSRRTLWEKLSGQHFYVGKGSIRSTSGRTLETAELNERIPDVPHKMKGMATVGGMVTAGIAAGVAFYAISSSAVSERNLKESASAPSQASSAESSSEAAPAASAK